ncbi:phage tail protein I [Lachnoanaerobaculum gingivalis]|uniref:phage tail protein I n=1 Tax=Lachnoanaerobaculum gingivalis TaxID=2490855 RepID=UPI0028D55CF7|nr:phage tail protein I [Lachnoanaerobaculum gingivalis]
MIKYNDAELISVLPHLLSSDPDIAAISYAYKKAMAKLIVISAQTVLYADIENMDEELLDLMALECRTQYYKGDLPIETKRKLVKNSLIWHQKAGTIGAVNELIDTVLGEGEVVEWFNFGGDPGTFKILTSAKLSDSSLKYFQEIISNIKNMGSSLISVEQSCKIDVDLYVGASIVQSMKTVIK